MAMAFKAYIWFSNMFLWVVRKDSKTKKNIYIIYIRAVVSGSAGGTLAHQELGMLLTLFQPEGADYAHHITGSTPGFGNLTTALYILGNSGDF